MTHATPVTPAPAAPTPEAIGAFWNKVLADYAGAQATLLLGIGDRMGLLKALARGGPATPAEFAERAGIDARYAREWLAALASGQYLDYEPATGRFALKPEAGMFLADEGAPSFVGGAYQQFLGATQLVDRLVQAFRDGRGIRLSEYPADFLRGMERFTAAWHDHLLVQQWIPLVPDLEGRLRKGIRVADLGCGTGRAAVRLAQAFSASSVDGFDVHAPSLTRAAALAREQGVQDRARFHEADVVRGLPGKYDLVTLFDLLHDTADPLAVLKGVRASLNPGGSALVLEMNAQEPLEANFGPFGTICLAGSICYCMSAAIAAGGEGIGTLGMPEVRLRELAAQAGFREVWRVPMENPVNSLYELRA